MVISVHPILYNSQTCDVEILSIQVFLLTDCLQPVLTARITALSPMLKFSPGYGWTWSYQKPNQMHHDAARVFRDWPGYKPVSLHFTSWRKMNWEHLIGFCTLSIARNYASRPPKPTYLINPCLNYRMMRQDRIAQEQLTRGQDLPSPRQAGEHLTRLVINSHSLAGLHARPTRLWRHNFKVAGKPGFQRLQHH